MKKFIKNLITKDYVITYVLKVKLFVIFFAFIGFFFVLIFNNSWLLSLNKYDIIIKDQIIFNSLVEKISESLMFNNFIDYFPLDLTVNGKKLFGLLILGYILVVLLVILSLSWKIFILPLISIAGSIFMFFFTVVVIYY